jgi:hypothetical protein
MSKRGARAHYLLKVGGPRITSVLAETNQRVVRQVLNLARMPACRNPTNALNFRAVVTCLTGTLPGGRLLFCSLHIIESKRIGRGDWI